MALIVPGGTLKFRLLQNALTSRALQLLINMNAVYCSDVQGAGVSCSVGILMVKCLRILLKMRQRDIEC